MRWIFFGSLKPASSKKQFYPKIKHDKRENIYDHRLMIIVYQISNATSVFFFHKHPIFCALRAEYISILSQSACADTEKKHSFDNVRHSEEKKLYRERKATHTMILSLQDIFICLLAHLLSNLPRFSKCSNDFKFTSRSTRNNKYYFFLLKRAMMLIFIIISAF